MCYHCLSLSDNSQYKVRSAKYVEDDADVIQED